MTMPLHLLRQFHAVVRAGGFARAAAVLHISQPAVSKAVQELEARLGVVLLERGRAGLRPTEAGMLLLTRAGEIFAIEHQAEEELAALRGLEGGSLRIGASTTIATYILPPLLAAFCARFPRVKPRLISANTAQIAQALAAREVEVALVEGHVDQPGLRALPWRTDEMVFVAAPGQALAGHKRRLLPADFEASVQICREPGSGTREAAAAACLQAGITPAQLVEVGSTEAIMRMVAAGFGFAVVSAAAAADQLALGKLCRLDTGASLERRLWRLELPGRAASAAGARFLEVLG